MRGRKPKVQTEIYQINERWRIDQDKQNFILQHKGRDEGKDEGGTWVTVGYYQTVNQLFHALVEKNMKGLNLADFKAINDKINELHSFIDKASGIMSQTKEGVE